MFTGRYAINPYSGEKIPIWIGNFVLMDYGTGAIMAVPAHDERDFDFCTTFGIPIRSVIRPVDGPLDENPKAAFAEDGVTEKSGEFSGLPSEEARRKDRTNTPGAKMASGKAAITFRIKDWGISRQRYWGTPIPPADPLPEMPAWFRCPRRMLPVTLPYDVKFTGKGRSPLAEVASFMNVSSAPVCGDGRATRKRYHGHVRRFVLVFLSLLRSPERSAAPFDSAAHQAYWFPIDQYIGGVEHAILHLIYSRFFTKVMRDIGSC